MAFPPEFLDELRARVGLAGLVGRYVKLTRKGREHSGCCPFHNEKTPSFTINEDKGFFHCFGCGAHGDAIGFEMRHGHLGFTEAVEKLAAEVGLEMPRSSPEERYQEERRASLHEAMEAACGFFERQLRTPAGREGLGYLLRRGLSEASIARFRLGWAPGGQGLSREGLKTALMTKACPESLLLEAGLLKQPEGGGGSYDFFRGRVTFPVTDRKGRIIAFGARSLGDGQPKYLNSPETALFHKGATLYGLSHARETARQGNVVLAVEGYMDVIVLHQAGFSYAVAPLGTALTETQIEELWRLAEEPILCFDGDAAGQRAMQRAAERGLPGLKPGKSLRFAILPKGEDPDSLIGSKGTGAMQAVLDAATPLFEMVWSMATVGRVLDTPERRAALERDLHDKVVTIAHEGVRRQYQSAFRERMWQHFRPIRQVRPAWNGPGGNGKGGFGGRRPGDPPLRPPGGRLPGVGAPIPPASAQSRQEQILLAVLIVHPSLLEMAGERLGEMSFSDKNLDNLRRGILKHLDIARDLDSEAWRNHLRSDGFSHVLDSFLDARACRIARPDALHEARSLWEHVFGLYVHKELEADVGYAVDAFAREPSETNYEYLTALVRSRERARDEDDTWEKEGQGGSP